jgi:hypothetical protein
VGARVIEKTFSLSPPKKGSQKAAFFLNFSSLIFKAL